MAFVVGVILGCGEKKDLKSEPVNPGEFATTHKQAVEAFRAKLDAAAKLVKDLPAKSVRVADPEGPFVLIQQKYTEGENAFIVSGSDLRILPEFGKYEGKDIKSGETGITIVYADFLDFQSAYSMLEGGKPRFDMTGGAADYLMQRMSQMRYVIIGREVSYSPGTIDKAARTFVPGTFDGVAHVVDLQGPKHLGSVSFRATNSGSFESYSGSEAFMLQMDLRKAVVDAFIVEMGKIFPKIKMPELAK